jgi:hypothetical protein
MFLRRFCSLRKPTYRSDIAAMQVLVSLLVQDQRRRKPISNQKGVTYMKLKQEVFGKVFLTAAIAFSSISARAQLALNLGYIFSGVTNPPANPATPWVTASFADQGANVLFTLIGTANLTGTEDVMSFYFNFDDALNLPGLGFSLVSTNGAFNLPSITLDENNLKADGDGKYDIRLDFTTGMNVSQTFGAGDSISFLLIYTGTLDETNFTCLSAPAGGSGPFYAAAHIQNTTGGQSAWVAADSTTIVPIPEPSTFALVVFGSLMCLLAVRDRKR